MKRRYWKGILICALICVIAAACLGAAENPDVRTVKSLLEARTDIMQNVLYGKIPYEQGKRELQQIETDALYQQDLEQLKQWQNTDLEPIGEMKLLSLEKLREVYDVLHYRAEIQWVYRQSTADDRQSGLYDIGVRKSNGTSKLISLKLQE